MITLIGFFKVVSFLIGAMLLINLIKQESEYNNKNNNIKY